MSVLPFPLDPPNQLVTVNLAHHLEWQPDGFSLVFLFAAAGPALRLADWLDQQLLSLGLPLDRQELRDDFAVDPETMVGALLAQQATVSGPSGAMWLAAQHHPGDARWNRARKIFLARLNERRYLLERDFRRPLVLVFPADFRPQARNIAPDLWHVRALSGELFVHAPLSPGA